jgi:hypothetical protein
VTTLDAVPDLRSGQEALVGFTIRQHGVTPVALEGVSIELSGPAGERVVVPAVPEGPRGHYVARVRPSQGGAWAFTVNQGWFGPQELGVFEVGGGLATAGERAAPRAPGGAAAGAWLAAARVGLPVLAAALAVVAFADLRARPRRSPAAASTAAATTPSAASTTPTATTATTATTAGT